MGRNVRLDDIVFNHPEVDAAFVKWREAIEGAQNWSVTGSVNFTSTKDGYALHVKGGAGAPIKAKVATGGLTARVSDTQDGVGNAVLYDRTAGTAARVAGATVVVYNPFNVIIPATTTIVVAVEPGGTYLCIGSDCLT